MKKLIILLLPLFILTYSNAKQTFHYNCESNKTKDADKLEVTPLDKKELQELRLAYNGVFIKGVKWKDVQGNHIVFYSATGLHESRNSNSGDGMSSEIFAYHYIYDDNPDFIKNLWVFEEFVLDCPLSTLLEFVDNSLHVTDLNNDKTAEVWFIYRGGCMGDITPWPMSIVMYEGSEKFTLSGEVKILLERGKSEGGKYQSDTNFKNAPSIFRKYANELWEKHCFYYDYSKEK